jgi:hypothetical protein
LRELLREGVGIVSLVFRENYAPQSNSDTSVAPSIGRLPKSHREPLAPRPTGSVTASTHPALVLQTLSQTLRPNRGFLPEFSLLLW